jgi:precorrin-2/cobalt-factor-2 C20-methyltransferase
MAELKGTFYGVSVGPGDPELMTLQAVRLIRQCPVLAAPQTASGQMLALDIARSALGEALDGKTIVPLYFAMSRDPAALAASHEKAAAAVQQYLDAGQDVAMLNIGDVSIYATFGYLQEILQAGGYATAMAAGVPSFCAAAARLNVPLTGGMDTPLTIAPGGWTDRSCTQVRFFSAYLPAAGYPIRQAIACRLSSIPWCRAFPARGLSSRRAQW